MKDRRKHTKAKDFIGSTFNNGSLIVVGVHGKQGSKTVFSVHCKICHDRDPELFPRNCFKARKEHLENGHIPCGCSNSYDWTEEQYIILINRKAKDRFVVHGFTEEFKNQTTRVHLECLKDGYRWTASIHNIVNNNTGCCKCAGTLPLTEQIALQKCIDICNEMDYDVVGFPNGYKNNKSRFEYICKVHGKQSIRYSNFVDNNRRCYKCQHESAKNKLRKPLEKAFDDCSKLCQEFGYIPVGFLDGYVNAKSKFTYQCLLHGFKSVTYNSFTTKKTKCPDCAVNGYSTSKQGTFYVYQWTKDDHSFIKFGITNQKLISRIKQQKRETEYKYRKIWSATFEDGSIPLYIENFIKGSELIRGVVDKEEFADGFTETVRVENLVALENIIVEAMSKLHLE